MGLSVAEKQGYIVSGSTGVMPCIFIFPLRGMEQGDAANVFVLKAFT